MAAMKDKYFEKILETLVDHNDRHNAPLSNEKLRQAVSKVVAETEEEERNANSVTMEELNANNVTMDTFHQSPVKTNTQIKNANVPNKKRISSGILAEMIKGFHGLKLCSIINDSGYYNSDEDDAESDPKSDPKSNQLVAACTSDGKKRKVADTDTTNGNSPQKLLINRTIPVIISLIDPPIADWVAASIGTFHA